MKGIGDAHMTTEKKRDIVREGPMTYEEYANLPDDGHSYELVDGYLELMSPSPNRSHQMIVGRLLALLTQYCETEYLVVPAPVDVVISSTEVRQPDLVVIRLDRMAIYKSRGCIVEPPDLIIEVLSPSSLKRDKVDKARRYAEFGVPEYWLVSPIDETLEQHVLTSDGRYQLVNVYSDDEHMTSESVRCADFTMDDLLSLVRTLPDN